MKRKNTILIIDNDRNFTTLLKKFLTEMCGYAVKIVPDGYNGVITAKKIIPGLVVLDIRMPSMNGLKILEQLKSSEETAHIPVIILTGFDDDEIRNKALALKASAYLVKPISLEVLHEKIAFWLEARLER
jgi:Response regulator containing CheY-like receiver, AAA-type ATPase, and DNA-binding domains